MARTRRLARTRRRIAKRFGWIPDLPDQRDHEYRAPLARLGPLPPRVDMRRACPPVYNQGALGSCTANAIAGALEFDHLKQMLPDFVPSRLFIYYNERVIEGTVDSDAGAMLRDGIKSVARDGAPPEPLWPYLIARFRQRPSPTAYREARKHRAIVYERIRQDDPELRGCLASGYPFVFGFSVYESFETDAVRRSGRVPMPAAGERLLGGHAVLAVGYDAPARTFVVRNSWGREWGKAGYFTMPFAYLLDENLSADFWTIKLVD